MNIRNNANSANGEGARGGSHAVSNRIFYVAVAIGFTVTMVLCFVDKSGAQVLPMLFVAMGLWDGKTPRGIGVGALLFYWLVILTITFNNNF